MFILDGQPYHLHQKNQLFTKKEDISSDYMSVHID